MMDFSPKYNPLEKHLLRFIIVHYISTKPLKELQNFKVEEFNFKALHRLWNVCIVELQRSTFPFKAYIIPKELEFEDTIDKHGYNGTFSN